MNFNKLLTRLKLWYKNYKAENLIIKNLTDITPSWEKKLTLVMFFILLITTIVNFIIESNNNHELFLEYKRVFNACYAIPGSTLLWLTGNDGKREFKAIKKYYNLNKTKNLSKQQRTIVTSTIFIMVVKPVIKFCFKCSGGLLATNYAYSEHFGFSPLREIGLANTKIQTSEQAWYHITHPQEYTNSPDLPIIQDLKKENTKLKNIINKT